MIYLNTFLLHQQLQDLREAERALCSDVHVSIPGGGEGAGVTGKLIPLQLVLGSVLWENKQEG